MDSNRLYFNFIKKIKNNYMYRSVFITFTLVLFILLPLGIFLDNQYKKRLIQNKRYEVRNNLNKYSILLTNIINERFYLLTSLEIFVQNNWNDGIDESDFNKFTQGLYSTAAGIRNFIIAPDGVNEYVYPIEKKSRSYWS